MRLLLCCWVFAYWIERCVGIRNIRVYNGASGDYEPLFDRIGEWKEAAYTGDDYPKGPLFSTAKGGFLISFRSSLFTLYLSHPPGSSISVWLDGKIATWPFVFENQTTVMPDADWNDGIPDMRVMDAEVALEDHQLLVNISASEENPAIFNWLGVLDNDAADGPGYGSIEPAFVPHGVIMDDPNELLEYSDSGWQHIRDWFSYEDTTSITSKPGAWMQVALSGKSIWVYGRIPVEGVVFSLEVIKKYGPEPSRNVTIYNLTRSDLDVPIYRFPLLAHKDLEYANAYSYNITLISGTLAIDFVGVDGKLVPSNFGDIHSTDRVDPPQPIQTAFDPKVVIPVVFGVTFALLLCALSFFLFKRYRARRTLRLGFGIDEPGECDKPIVQSSHPSFIGPAHIIVSNTTKGSHSRLQPTLTRYPRSSSSCLTSNNNSTFAESMSSDPERTSSPDLESQDPSRMSREEYVMEDGEPLSLSHADLATVFRRAEELRSRGPQEGEATLGELEPHLEALARQLANSTQ